MSNHQRIDRALLIGIDRYLHIAPNLTGCVGDVEALKALLVGTLHTPAENIIALTSSMEGGEAPEALATRANIVATFERLAAAAGEGERIYVHYSGHGMRNDSSLMPDLEPDGRDEAIAPADSGYADPAAHYILDKELGWLLRQITDRGAFVTVVMDCCHSASGTREIDMGAQALTRRGSCLPGDARTRRWEGGDPRPRPDATLVAPLSALREVIAAPEGATGSLLPPPKSYILLTGCRESETTKEYRNHGAFTWFMLEVLKSGMAGLTYRTLADRVAAGILELASRNPSYGEQTPQVEGNADLLVFGGETVITPRTMMVAPRANGELLVTGGSATGMTAGTILALYPPGAVDVRSAEGRLGLAEVTAVRADTANARPVDVNIKSIPAGSKAVVLRPGAVRLRRRVGLPNGGAFQQVMDAAARAGVGGGPSPYIELVGLADRPHFLVGDDGDGNFQISDFRGEPLSRISPPLPMALETSAAQLVQRLEHIAIYFNAWELTNGEPSSALPGKVALSLKRAGSGRVMLAPGDRITLQAFNRAGKPLSAALLYFGPDWRIEQFWPAESDYTELRVTGDAPLELMEANVFLVDGEERCLERFKLFATERPTRFHSLELPPLDAERSIRDATRGLPNPLEALLASVSRGSATRDARPAAGSNTGDWTTAELEVETTRGA